MIGMTRDLHPFTDGHVVWHGGLHREAIKPAPRRLEDNRHLNPEEGNPLGIVQAAVLAVMPIGQALPEDQIHRATTYGVLQVRCALAGLLTRTFVEKVRRGSPFRAAVYRRVR